MFIILGVHWKDWCWSWNSNTLATSWEELTHWKTLWCWEGLGVGGEGDDRGWDGWMTSPTPWTWVWVNSRSWWWTGKPGMLWFMGLQRVRHNWATDLIWSDATILAVFIDLMIGLVWVCLLVLCSEVKPPASIKNDQMWLDVKEKWKWSESEVAPSCPTLCDPINCSLPGSS